MDVRATTDDPPDTGADTIVVGVFDGKGVPHDVEDGALEALVEAGEALGVPQAGGRPRRGAALDPRRAAARDDFDAERARIAAAVALGRARELGTRALCWELPHKVPDAVAGALVEGTLLAAYRYTTFKSEPDEDRGAGELIVSAHHDVAARWRRRGRREAANRARDLGNAPGERDDARGARRAGAGAAGRAPSR